MTRYISLSFLLLLSNFATLAHATFMYISAKPVTCLNHLYEIEITQFSYDGSSVIFGGLEIVYGDGKVENIPDDDFTISVIDNGRKITKYIKTHAFQGPGIFTINARFFNRTANIRNMSNSVNTPFYVGTILHIDPFLGCNTTPRLENFPLNHKSGTLYLQDFSFIDQENDSLSFHFTVPLQDREIPVINYWLPCETDTEKQRKISRICIDPYNGSLFMNSINLNGNYTVAIQINEWRKVNGTYYLMSSSILDYQLEIIESENNSPVISSLQDTAIVAGEIFYKAISISDPENDSIMVNQYGDFFMLMKKLNEYDLNYYPGPVEILINFTPTPEEVRSKPYKIIYSCTDKNLQEISLNNTRSIYVWIAAREHQPEPPINFIGQAISPNLINLYWKDTQDELGYIIERADLHFPQFNRLVIVPANCKYFNDSSVVENNTYRYRIKAVGTTMSAYRTIEVSTPDIITSLKGEKMDDNLLIYPNPSTGSFSLRNVTRFDYLEILDFSGRKVWTQNLEKTKEMEIYPGLSKGTYLLNLYSADNTLCKKIVIK